MDPNSKSFPTEPAPISLGRAERVGQIREDVDADKFLSIEIPGSDQSIRHSKNNAIRTFQNKRTAGIFRKVVQPVNESLGVMIEYDGSTYREEDLKVSCLNEIDDLISQKDIIGGYMGILGLPMFEIEWRTAKRYTEL